LKGNFRFAYHGGLKHIHRFGFSPSRSDQYLFLDNGDSIETPCKRSLSFFKRRFRAGERGTIAATTT
jgi:hypothetical protein